MKKNEFKNLIKEAVIEALHEVLGQAETKPQRKSIKENMDININSSQNNEQMYKMFQNFMSSMVQTSNFGPNGNGLGFNTPPQPGLVPTTINHIPSNSVVGELPAGEIGDDLIMKFMK